jgi:uncharacterized protein (TIGR03032 family)
VPLLFNQSDSFVALLRQLGASLWVTTYQAQQLLVARATADGISLLVRTFDKPMGLAVDARRLALGCRDRIWLLRNAPDIAAQLEPAGTHDGCFLPRSCHVTGDIAGHEMAWATPHPQPLSPGGRGEEGDQWLVNTRFSCLCTLHPDYSFVPRWRPPFVSGLAAEDRCHLNGLALASGEGGGLAPRYVTALGQTDTPGGWRPGKATGGCLLEVPSGEVVARGLCMPHSPRLHQGRLWLLESGTGRLLRLDGATGRTETVTEQLPGYARGLALAGPYAFIGLSKIRATSAMDGVPLAQRRAELKCGVAVVDLRRGQVVGGLEFETAVEEIFDVQLLPGIRFPEVVGFQKDTLQHTFIVPAADKRID